MSSCPSLSFAHPCPSCFLISSDLILQYCQKCLTILAWYRRINYIWQAVFLGDAMVKPSNASPQKVGTVHCTPVFTSLVFGPSPFHFRPHRLGFWGMRGSWRDLGKMIWEGVFKNLLRCSNCVFESRSMVLVSAVGQAKRLRNHVLHPLKSCFAIVLIAQIST